VLYDTSRRRFNLNRGIEKRIYIDVPLPEPTAVSRTRSPMAWHTIWQRLSAPLVLHAMTVSFVFFSFLVTSYSSFTFPSVNIDTCLLAPFTHMRCNCKWPKSAWPHSRHDDGHRKTGKKGRIPKGFPVMWGGCNSSWARCREH